MRYEVVITVQMDDMKIRKEKVTLTAMTENDAKYQMGVNREIAERRYGKTNVISVDLSSTG